MSASDERPLRRLLQARWILLAAALGALIGGFFDFSTIGLVLFAVAGAGAGALVPVAGAKVPQPEPVTAAPEPEPKPGFEGLFTALPNPSVLLDGTLAIVAFNRHAQGLLPNLKVGEPIAFALRNPDVIDAIRAVAERGDARRVDYSERVPVERALEAQITKIPPKGPVLLVLRDVTQQHRIEQMRADFVANASHELRTPLASVLGFIETLQGPAKNDPAARERFLEIMRSQANRMSRLIDDLLSLSRIELNAHVAPDTTVEIGAIIAHIVDTLAPLARDRGVEIGLFRPTEPLYIFGDRDELLRVFENLVENGVKYGASGGKVDVRVEEVPRGDERRPEIVVSIRDYGPGIAAEHLPRLTERFYRVDVAQSRDKGGTGLGLAIVKHIVARHRARLVIESRPGAGATFTVRFEKAV